MSEEMKLTRIDRFGVPESSPSGSQTNHPLPFVEPTNPLPKDVDIGSPVVDRPLRVISRFRVRGDGNFEIKLGAS